MDELMTKLKVSAADYLPSKLTLPNLQKASKKCHGCHLYKKATQTVFGEGPNNASLMVVGEIPGKVEDETGHPFTGPAGTLLKNSFEEIDIDWEDLYFTNVVKHFKFEYLNKRKMHRSPVGAEINACMPWLDAEIKVIQPKLILCLGLTAAKALVGNKVSINRDRGKVLPFRETLKAFITFHPSAILRAVEDKDRHRMKRLFVNDLRKAADFIAATVHG